METCRLRVKLGPYEFEAEGAREDVAAQFDEWKGLIGPLPKGAPMMDAPPPGQSETAAGSQPSAGRNGETGNGHSASPLARLFRIDDENEVLGLKVLPKAGNNPGGDTILVLLYGYHELRHEDELLATRLMAALRASYSTLDRADRAAEPYVRQGLLTKVGVGKGGTYRLTPAGLARAKEIAGELTNQLI